jgi:hypothetical protein
MWIDAMDTEGNWYEAQIKDVSEDGHKVLIHYKGFAAKWDEWIAWDDTSRRKPLNYMTQKLSDHDRQWVSFASFVPSRLFMSSFIRLQHPREHLLINVITRVYVHVYMYMYVCVFLLLRL